MAPSYLGGQCPDFYRFEGGQHTIIYYDPETGAELDRYTALFEANTNYFIRGPIKKVYPLTGDIFGGHYQGYMGVESGQDSLYLYRAFDYEYKNTANWIYSKCISANYSFIRVNGQPDNCGHTTAPSAKPLQSTAWAATWELPRRLPPLIQNLMSTLEPSLNLSI